ncbi:hypothetical protein QNO08_17330 (plasmid) [Arthrobacter sp. zg-Y820]|uniref:hypothetical protein n=1 Tax=unclassified Arthrobacter TaxID=235627 RepID=UPI001E3ED5B4|nr:MULTISPECIES: hypothetical protein [unclassified Arthrobacter]MCC9198511.1 hypothetical protein [Arthrobacter sp. zg-Y820]MDK1281381.1 hypothetical protein [Arthrobacter sp. zg.Y820]WIB11227.1 hypothetical protein QNO08_17330 [Arthrobacter sp. zg-Y820]
MSDLIGAATLREVRRLQRKRMPVPKDSYGIRTPKPGVREITATATRNESGWIIEKPEISKGAHLNLASRRPGVLDPAALVP